MDKISELEFEIQELKNKISYKEQQLRLLKQSIDKSEENSIYSPYFTNTEVQKYCRQIIVPQIGVEGQNSIKNAKVCVVGVGGLGCPALQYLAAAGVGTLGFIDSDLVSISNLHRQILFEEQDVGQSKVSTAFSKLRRINSGIKLIPFELKLGTRNCVDVFQQFDVILDCTDNIPTRYLVNDVCILLQKPLIAANAIKFEGQLIKIIPQVTPCYRCLFTTPPDPACVGACNEDGVLGAVPGLMGTLQALEAIKHVCKIGMSEMPKLTIFDAESLIFRHLSMRSRNLECVVCGQKPSISLDSLPDYEKWCGMAAQEETTMYPPKIILPEDQRIDVKKIVEMKAAQDPYFILDVRPKTEFEMCRLPNSINCSLKELFHRESREHCIEHIKKKLNDSKKATQVFVLCRCGNDSQLAVKLLRNAYGNEQLDNDLEFFDVDGGLYSWQKIVDCNFPLY